MKGPWNRGPRVLESYIGLFMHSLCSHKLSSKKKLLIRILSAYPNLDFRSTQKRKNSICFCLSNQTLWILNFETGPSTLHCLQHINRNFQKTRRSQIWSYFIHGFQRRLLKWSWLKSANFAYSTKLFISKSILGSDELTQTRYSDILFILQSWWLFKVRPVFKVIGCYNPQFTICLSSYSCYLLNCNTHLEYLN